MQLGGNCLARVRVAQPQPNRTDAFADIQSLSALRAWLGAHYPGVVRWRWRWQWRWCARTNLISRTFVVSSSASHRTTTAQPRAQQHERVCNRLNAEDAVMRAGRHEVCTYEHNTQPKPHAVDVIHACINVRRGRSGICNNNDTKKQAELFHNLLCIGVLSELVSAAAVNVSSISVTSETPLVSARAHF